MERRRGHTEMERRKQGGTQRTRKGEKDTVWVAEKCDEEEDHQKTKMI